MFSNHVKLFRKKEANKTINDHSINLHLGILKQKSTLLNYKHILQ